MKRFGRRGFLGGVAAGIVGGAAAARTSKAEPASSSCSGDASRSAVGDGTPVVNIRGEVTGRTVPRRGGVSFIDVFKPRGPFDVDLEGWEQMDNQPLGFVRHTSGVWMRPVHGCWAEMKASSPTDYAAFDTWHTLLCVRATPAEAAREALRRSRRGLSVKALAMEVREAMREGDHRLSLEHQQWLSDLPELRKWIGEREQ
jgi:hypothetical protein